MGVFGAASLMSSRVALPALAPTILLLTVAPPAARAHASIVPDSACCFLSQSEGEVDQIAPAPETPLQRASEAPVPSPWITLTIVLVACPCAWALWRWRLLMPRPGVIWPPHAQAWDRPEGDIDRLRLRLEGATLMIAGLCVWTSQALGAASARALFRLTTDDARTPGGIALLSAGAYSGAILAAALCMLALPPMARRIGLSPSARAAASGVLLFALVFPIVLAIGSVAMWFSYGYALLTDQPAPTSVAHETLRQLINPDAARNGAWWGAIGAVVIGAPLVEEFIYRGCLQSALDRACRGFAIAPRAWPVVITSLIFMAAHATIAEPRALVTLFALSLTFGAAYRRTGSLAAPFVMHALFNAANIAMAL
jgi:membrane protease YdiL (CAAX protease family)